MWKSALLLTVLCAGCASDDEPSGAGKIAVVAYGESFIEEGISATDMDDGWAIEFSRFDVTLRDITVADTAIAGPATLDVSVASNGAGHEVGRISVSAGEYAEPSFTVERVGVSGRAVRDDRMKSFEWVLDSPTRYEHCETSTVVEDGRTATFQITVHADHLFHDSLVAESPQMLFEPLAAADVDDDGEVTEAELKAADIGAYDPGNEDVDDLWSWLLAQSRTLGHVDGEGHCDAFGGG
jgi:hypothetical protein